MFRSLPLSLKTDVWDRIDTYLNEYAATHRNFNPNRSALVEEAVIFFLDAKEAEASGASTETESTEEMSPDMEMSSEDTSMETEESTEEEAGSDESGESASEDSSEEGSTADEAAEAEEAEEAEAPMPARRSSAKKGK